MLTLDSCGSLSLVCSAVLVLVLLLGPPQAQGRGLPVLPAEQTQRWVTAGMVRNMAGQGTAPESKVASERAYSASSMIRLHLDYSHLGSGAAGQRVRQEVMPLAAAQVQGRVGVARPVEGNLTLTPRCESAYSEPEGCLPGRHGDCTVYCASHLNREEAPGLCSAPKPEGPGIEHRWRYFGSFQVCNAQLKCVTHGGQEGAADSDVIVYVAAEPFGCGGSRVARAEHCMQDPITGRPLAAFINFCPEALMQLSVAAAVEAAVHEMLHALVFSLGLMASFVDGSGAPLALSAVFGTDSLGRTIVRTRTVRQKGTALLGCREEIAGIPLEMDGDGGQSGTVHWDPDVVGADIMASGPDAAQRPLFGSLTMALLEDSGWYTANWDAAADSVPVGYSRCSLLSQRCEDFVSRSLHRGEFCHGGSGGNLHCLPDRRSRGRCVQAKGRPVCGRLSPSDLGGGLNGNCFDEANTLGIGNSPELFFGSHFGAYSRCIEVNSPLDYGAHWTNTTHSQGGRAPQCVQMSCSSEGALRLVVHGVAMDCPAGKLVNLSDHLPFARGVLGPCPAAEEICPALSCPGDCSGRGRCLSGRCACDIGFSGHDCGAPACVPGSCGSRETCDIATGLCQTEPAVRAAAPGPALPERRSSPLAASQPAVLAPTPSRDPESRQPPSAAAHAPFTALLATVSFPELNSSSIKGVGLNSTDSHAASCGAIARIAGAHKAWSITAGPEAPSPALTCSLMFCTEEQAFASVGLEADLARELEPELRHGRLQVSLEPLPGAEADRSSCRAASVDVTAAVCLAAGAALAVALAAVAARKIVLRRRNPTYVVMKFQLD